MTRIQTAVSSEDGTENTGLSLSEVYREGGNLYITLPDDKTLIIPLCYMETINNIANGCVDLEHLAEVL
jgi:hypothetical protein